MSNWALPNGFDTGTRVAGPFYLLSPFPAPFVARSPLHRDEPLPKDFPDYIVYMTRKFLYAATTSLSRVSAQVHDFFLRISQILAFDRMVRSLWSWSIAVAAPWGYAVDQGWLRTITPEPPLLTFWGTSVPALPKPQTPTSSFTQTVPDMTSALANFASAISASAALFSFGPMFMQSWGFAA